MLLSHLILGFFALGAVATSAGTRQADANPLFRNPHVMRLTREMEQAKRAGDLRKVQYLEGQLQRAQRMAFRQQSFYETQCSADADFSAEIYAVDLHNPPAAVAWAVEELAACWRRDDDSDLPHPGDFNVYVHRNGSEVIKTDYEKLPWAVKKWHEEQLEKKTVERKWIAVVNNVAFFAPIVVTRLLPLFAVANMEQGKDSCIDELVDLANYRYARYDPSVRFTKDRTSLVRLGNSITLKLSVSKKVRKHKEADVHATPDKKVEQIDQEKMVQGLQKPLTGRATTDMRD